MVVLYYSNLSMLIFQGGLRLKPILGFISALIPTVLSVFIINFLFDIVPLKIQGLPIVLPFALCPIGAIVGFFGYTQNRNKLALFGLIFNGILFIFPVIFNIIATVIGGP